MSWTPGTNTVIANLSSDDGHTGEAYEISHPTKAICNVGYDWAQCLEKAKADDPNEWSANDVIAGMKVLGYDVTYISQDEVITLEY
jgi:hypothetical protein